MTTSPLQVALLRQLDEVCDRFEQAWLAGEVPSAEALLEDVPLEARPALLRELLRIECEYRQRRGDPLGIIEANQRFLTLGEWVEPVLAALQLDRPAPTDLQGETEGTIGPAAENPASASTSLAGYERIERLGMGGMGAVYKAFDPALQRWVALKCIRRERFSEEAIQRFRREGQSIARLSHPHIVQVFGWAEYEGQPALVMEYVPGGSLADVLKDRTLSATESAQLVAVIAWAVQHAHDRGIVHRDLKPGNVLLAEPVPGSRGNTSVGFPKVGDFGLARPLEDTGLTAEGLVLGTAAFMSPEQAEGETASVGPPADVWALGVILYQLLARRLPFQGTSTLKTLRRIVEEEPEPLRVVNPAVPAALAELCEQCLQKASRRRPTAAELAERLEQFVAETPAAPDRINAGVSSPSRASTRTYVATPPRPIRRRHLWLAGGAALFGIAVLSLTIPRLGPRPLSSARAPNLFPGAEAALPPAAGPTGREVGPAPAGARPVRIKPIEVTHWEIRGRTPRDRGRVGVNSFRAVFGDAVTLNVGLERPGYFYLIGFNFDGKEQLLWPRNPDGTPDPTTAPSKLQELVYPGGEDWLYLEEDDATEGLQCYVMAASHEPLPPYAEWRKKVGALPWRRLSPNTRVWEADDLGLYPVTPGKGADRGDLRPALNLEDPPMDKLCRALRVHGVEKTEAIAFPVLAKAAKP